MFSSIVMINNNGSFEIKKLPTAAQFSPVNGIGVIDYNGDEYPDLVLAGNLYDAEIETTRADAGIGTLLIGGKDGLTAVPSTESGLYLNYNVKDLKTIKLANNTTGVLVASNDDQLRLLSFDKK